MNSKYCRYSLGFLLFSLILFAFYFSDIALLIVSIFFIIIALREYRKMFEQKEIHIHKFLPEIISIVLAVNFCTLKNIEYHLIVTPLLIIGTILSFIITILRNKKPYMLTSMATAMSFTFVLCGLSIIKLTYRYGNEKSWYIILIYFLSVLLGDFIASKIGPKFTKKLAPEISPNKTIGGAIANLITACIVCATLNFLTDYSIIQCITLGTTISIFAQFGDLTISMLKRDIGIKHSGTLFYEYGGILDRMDAFIFSAPAAYYCLMLLS